jgi:hypothetical protein
MRKMKLEPKKGKAQEADKKEFEILITGRS